MQSIGKEEKHENFVILFTQAQPALRSFVRSLVFSWDDVDEVMQNTGLVLWRKFSDFDPETEFIRWACAVARFEVLAWRRDKARNRHVFDEDLIDLLADTAEEERASLSVERSALEICLRKLPAKMGRAVVAAYEPGVKLNEVARDLGKSATAFYKMLNRARASLQECISFEKRKGIR